MAGGGIDEAVEDAALDGQQVGSSANYRACVTASHERVEQPTICPFFVTCCGSHVVTCAFGLLADVAKSGGQHVCQMSLRRTSVCHNSGQTLVRLWRLGRYGGYYS